jgi:hypothetical protein
MGAFLLHENQLRFALINMENYQLKPIESGGYLKVVDGEVLGAATAGEVRCYLLRKKFPSVEAGFLEVALALAGVTGVLSTISEIPAVQVVSVAAFFFSVLGAYNLTWLYIQPRIPITWTHFFNSPVKKRYPWFPLTLWLPFYFLKQGIRLSISSKDAEDRLLETSYLMLFIAVIAAELALLIFVLLELRKTISGG